MAEFVEKKCVVQYAGKKFEAGGAWILNCTDGYQRGAVYAKPEATPPCVTDWHGNVIAPAQFGTIYQGNFCCMRPVSFTLDGVKFIGRYCPDHFDAVRVRSTKRVGGDA